MKKNIFFLKTFPKSFFATSVGAKADKGAVSWQEAPRILYQKLSEVAWILSGGIRTYQEGPREGPGEAPREAPTEGPWEAPREGTL